MPATQDRITELHSKGIRRPLRHTATALSQLGLLRTVNEIDMKRLERLLPLIDWDADQPMPGRLRADNHLFVVRSGRVALLGRAPNGNEMMIALLEPGDVYATLGGVSAPDAIALEDAQITPINETTLRNLSARYPQVGIDLAEMLCDQIALLREVVVGVGQMHADDRLWARLVSLTERIGIATPGGAELRLDLTHAQWARLTGASRESITLALGRFRKEGRITMNGRTITIPYDQLQDAA